MRINSKDVPQFLIIFLCRNSSEFQILGNGYKTCGEAIISYLR